MRSHRGSQHVCAVRMSTVVSPWSRLSFAVCFNYKTAKVGNQFVDLVNFGFPPLCHFTIKGIGSFQPTDLNWGREARRKVNAYTVRPEYVSDCGDLLQVLG